MTQFAIDFARADRDEAVQRAVDAADGRCPKWSEVALEFVRLYAMQHRGEKFIGRDITQAAKERGLESPASPKAWGGPIQKAVRLGIIRKVGVAQDPNRHCALVPEFSA